MDCWNGFRKSFFFPGFRAGFPKEGEFLVALKNVLFGSIRVLFFNSPDKSYFPAKIGETGRKKISSGTKKLVIFLSLERLVTRFNILLILNTIFLSPLKNVYPRYIFHYLLLYLLLFSTFLSFLYISPPTLLYPFLPFSLFTHSFASVYPPIRNSFSLAFGWSLARLLHARSSN